MQQNFAIKLDKQINNAVITNGNVAADGITGDQDAFLDQLRSETAQISQQQSRFKSIVDNLAHLQSEFFKQNKENIARLSVQIAERILAQKIQQGQYSIEEIIKQAIDNAPATEDIIVRLNPDDYATIEELIKSPETKFPKGVSFISDPKIKPAQCILETPKGIIESFIEDQLSKIEEALKKAE
jgi:flagellar biosynthesis/type III secretory pathway protein FliH